MTTEELEAKIKELEGVVVATTTERDTLKTTVADTNTKLQTSEKELGLAKEAAKEQGKNFKHLRDYSKEEKDLLTEKELELLQRSDKLEEDRAKDSQDRQTFEKTQKDERVNNLVNRLSRGDKEIADKIRVNLSRISGFDGAAVTEEALRPFVQDAFNMLGPVTPKVDPLMEAHQQGGATGEYKPDGSFAETADGKETANALGLKQALPPVEGAK